MANNCRDNPPVAANSSAELAVKHSEVGVVSPQELHDRFEAEIDKRGVDDKYIDGVEERELLQIAVQHGFATEWARNFLTDVCKEKGSVIEAAVVQSVRDKLRSTMRTDGRLDRHGFETLVRDVRGILGGTTRTDRDMRKLVAATLDDVGVRTVNSWWRPDWFGSIKRDLGVS
jgi:hypothetical protein